MGNRRLLLFILAGIFVNILILPCQDFHTTILTPQSLRTVPAASTFTKNDPTDPLVYWDSGLSYVESVNLAITIEKNETYEANSNVFRYYELFYSSPNWVDSDKSTIRVHGVILSPQKSSPDDKFPGFLLMHGLYSSAADVLQLGIELAEEGCLVLMTDHPGHGQSEGAKPSADNFYFKGDYNKTAHCFLTTCAAIQAIRLLQSWSEVNSSKIAVGGFSYGGLNSIYVSSVYSNHINLTMPMLVTGFFEQNAEENFIYSIYETAKEDIDPNFWNRQMHYFDPQYYLLQAELPEIFWGVGTHDEFFNYNAINETYNVAIENTAVHCQVHPNGHHVLVDYESTWRYMLRYKFNGGTAPPIISDITPLKTSSSIGDEASISFVLNCDATIVFVEISYRYRDIFGEAFRRVGAIKDPDLGAWKCNIHKAPLSSELEYIIIVHLEDGVWFTSQIFSMGVIQNNLGFLTIIGLVACLGLPALVILKKKFNQEINASISPKSPESPKIEASDQNSPQYSNPKRIFFIEIFAIVIFNVLIIGAMFLPWISFFGAVNWSLLYFLDQYFTWTWLIGDVGLYAIYIFFGCYFFCFLVSLKNPKKGGILYLVWPILFLIGNFVAAYYSMHNLPGVGFYLHLGSAIGLILLNRSKQKQII